MTNTNIQSPLPLSGPGFVFKESLAGGYKNGEMKKLVNMEFLDDTLVCRRQVTGERSGITSPVGFSGFIQGLPGVITTAGIDFAGGSLMGSTLPAVAGYLTTLEKTVDYRDVSYTLALEHENATPSNRRLVIYKVISANRTEPNFNLNATRFVIDALLGSDSAPQIDSSFEPYGGTLRGGFIFKDRLFVAVGDKLYWSKATDPTVWSIPDGGFASFDLPNNITAIAALNDTIYIAGTDKIFAFTYSVDIDTELVIRQVDSTFGAFDLTTFRGNVYAMCTDGLYTIQGLNVQKAIENPKNFGGTNNVGWQILGHDDYIYLLHYGGMGRRYDTTAAASAGRYVGKFPDALGSVGIGTNLYCLNVVTGCLFEYLINWPDITKELSYVTDMVTGNDISGSSILYFLTTDWTGTAASIHAATGSLIKTSPTSSRVPYDQLDPGVANSYCHMCLEAEFDQFVPDGSEGLTKKFRNLLIDGIFPGGAVHSFKVSIAHDNRAYKAPTVLEDNGLSTSRPPYPHRVPLNQRSKAINIRLFNTNRSTAVPFADLPTQRFLITDLRLLWAYTQRTTEYAEQVKTP